MALVGIVPLHGLVTWHRSVSWPLNATLVPKVIFAQLKFRMLHAMYNLPARKKRRKSLLVNSLLREKRSCATLSWAFWSCWPKGEISEIPWCKHKHFNKAHDLGGKTTRGHALACQNHKKMSKLLQFAIQTGKYNLVGSHTAVLCLFASHQKTKLNPVRHNKNKKSRNLFLIKKMIFRKKNLAIYEQVLFSGKSSLIYKHSSCPSPSLLQ